MKIDYENGVKQIQHSRAAATECSPRRESAVWGTQSFDTSVGAALQARPEVAIFSSGGATKLSPARQRWVEWEK